MAGSATLLYPVLPRFWAASLADSAKIGGAEGGVMQRPTTREERAERITAHAPRAYVGRGERI